MEIFIYVMTFILGTLIGSFCTLAVYRIPLNKNITHEHSVCTKCNHKLLFLDLIPIFSYIFLKGKCRHCKEPIRIRYLLLEILSGIVFFLFVFSLKLNVFEIEIAKFVYFVLGSLYIISLVLIAGIDKERKQVQKNVLVFGFIVSFIYIIYLYIVGQTNVYRYVIYLFIMCILVIFDMYMLKKGNSANYTIHILLLCILTCLFTDGEVFGYTAIVTLVLMAINLIYNKIKKKEEGLVPIAFHLCISNIAILILQNYIVNYLNI